MTVRVERDSIAPTVAALSLAALLAGLASDVTAHALGRGGGDGPLALGSLPHLFALFGLLGLCVSIPLTLASLGGGTRRGVLAALAVCLPATVLGGAWLATWADFGTGDGHLVTGTPAEQVAAAALVVASQAGVRDMGDVQAATAHGYVPVNPPGPLVHYVDPGFQRLAGRDPLTPDHPDGLVFGFGHRTVLLGVVFVRPFGSPGPSPGGALTPWHDHAADCMARDGSIARVGGAGVCPHGYVRGPAPEVLHVWLVDNPWGRFAGSIPRWRIWAVTA